MNKLTLISALICASLSTTALAAKGDGEQGSTNGQPFKTINERIDLVEMALWDAIAIIENQIEEIQQHQDSQDALIAFLQSAVSALEMRVEQNENDIEAIMYLQDLQGQLIGQLQDDLTALEMRVAANEDDISALLLADMTMQAMINAMRSQLVTINRRITLNDRDISTLQARASYLQRQISGLRAQLQTKQNRLREACPVGSSIRVIYGDGSVDCEVDDVSAGVGTLKTFTSRVNREISANIFVATRVTVTAYCPSGTRVMGGGHRSNGSLGVGHVQSSYPYTATSWRTVVRYDPKMDRTLTTFAVCGSVQ